MRILLVCPWSPGHRRYRSLLSPLISYQPLTIPVLAALIPPALGAEVDVCDEMASDYRRFLGKKYDVVAVSIISPESGRAYEIADRFREMGAYIVFGGYHMLYNSGEGLLHADTVVIGPAEKAWPQFLADFASGRPAKIYSLPLITADSFAAADRSVLSKRKYLRIPTVIGNPGCGNRCGFCAIHCMYPAGARRTQDVVRELEPFRGGTVIFYDPNFFGDRAAAAELMRAMQPLHLRWAGSACIGAAEDEELLELAQLSGCAGILVGLESVTGSALKGMAKGFNRPERYRENIAAFHRHGINVNGCFVLGMDDDTEEALLSLPGAIDRLGLDLARFSILTPVPHSPLFEKLRREGRILTEDWENYTQDRVVFAPKNMTPERLYEIYRTVWKETYRMGSVMRRVRRAKTENLRESFTVLGANLGFKFIGKDL